MTISLKNIKSQVDTRITNGGLSELACCQLQCAQTMINNGIKATVANFSSLPLACCNTGRLIYVSAENKYYYSNGEIWTSNFVSTTTLSTRQLWAWGCCFSLVPTRELCSDTTWCQVAVDASGNHFHAIKLDGSLWNCGDNTSGQLARGNTVRSDSFVREICSANNWSKVTPGCAFTLALKTDGSLWGWGNNGSGQLGTGNSTTVCSPVREACSASDWCQVAAAVSVSAAIKTNGSLWTWGTGNYGILLTGSTANCSKNTPGEATPGNCSWKKVQMGLCHGAALNNSCQIFTWGRGGCGELGTGVFCSAGTGTAQQVNFSPATGWCDLSVAKLGNWTLAMESNGTLRSWGRNNSFQLGNNSGSSNCNQSSNAVYNGTGFCTIYAGQETGHAIRTNGTLWTWGKLDATGAGGVGCCRPILVCGGFTDWCQVSTGNVAGAGIRVTPRGF